MTHTVLAFGLKLFTKVLRTAERRQANFRLQCLFHQPLHIPCNLLVGDLGVDLRAGNGRMSHHLGDAFYRNTCLQSQRTEAVAADMVGQRSTNATRQTYGFETTE